MQFSIVTILSLAIAATASPTLMERTTPAQEVQNQCGATATAACCNTSQKLALIPIGVTCVALNLVAVGPLAQQCGANQQVTCCSGSTTTQNGIINVGLGTTCVPVSV